MGKDIKNYGLPSMQLSGETNRDYYRELTEERKIVVSDEDIKLAESLNAEEMEGFNEILDHVMTNKGKVFFVDGPGGTEKTYLYRALLARVRSTDHIAIATATFRIAASIMPGGRTAHSRFKIPIKLEDNFVCNFTKQSGTAELLCEASLIIWDEVAMARRQAVETLDRSLQDITGCDLPFGGKIMVFGGDFRQVLLVVPRGTRAQICDATLLQSYIWDDIKIIRLKKNMRAQNDVWFSQFLLRIGDGTEKTFPHDYVDLPDDIMLEYNDDLSIDTLIDYASCLVRPASSDLGYLHLMLVLACRAAWPACSSRPALPLCISGLQRCRLAACKGLLAHDLTALAARLAWQ
ncbi:ATP-dependent DNA helicase PIF2-like [Panicum virgatum]|uniref:ATP-dependent DNA helicase PIF2-like n=1 Tax=Panicum virgatum TaxID=38727 RepID=UPI0019D67D55|nr:ATP-dependent DNA helicase PIF2-like [Panicum virgatum]